MDTRNALEQAWRERDEARAQGGTGMQHHTDTSTSNTTSDPLNTMRGIVNRVLSLAIAILILMNLETVVTAIPAMVYVSFIFWPVTLVIIAILLLVLVLRK